MENVVTNTQVYEYSVMTRHVLATLFLGCMLIQAGFAQDTPMSRRGKDLFEKAQKAWQARQLTEALNLYQSASALEPNNGEIHLRLAQIYDLQKNVQLTKKHYTQLVTLRPTEPQSAGAYQWLGKYHFQAARYDSALTYFEQASKLFPPKSNLLKLAEKSIASCRFAQKAVLKPLDVQKQSLGDTVNFLNAQFFPVLTADEETLIFSGITPNKDENIYTTHRIKGGWDVPEQISKSINTPENEGTCTISADGRTLVLTACNRPDGYGGCDLYISYKEGNDWSAPQNLGDVINTRDRETQPSLSADGHTLYFSSDRRGGIGKDDIWVSYLDEKGKWSTPKNMGPMINTPDEEIAPFIHANGHTLFYSSNGLPGMGGFDIFMSKRVDTTWSEPRNIGYPINTVAEQVGLFITASGKNAYYTDDNKGKSMLYTFAIPEHLKSEIVPTMYAKGKVFDKKTGKPQSSSIELYDLNTQSKVSEYTSDASSGEFLAVLNKGSEYAFYVSKPGYLFKSLSFAVTDSSYALRLDIPLEPVEKDHSETLNNIFFPTGEYALDEKSKVELDRMVQFLELNKTLKIEISGHTDDIGTDAGNLELSRKRALSVQEYLTKSGIPTERLSAKGYGKTRPVVPNNSEANRQQNRRIEWRVL
jgi:outer membrane protein OmpA-like peptidoglycan-associated protein/tetratricopeptide (TPR) repeat protein